MYKNIVKRLFDILAAVVLLPVLCPVFFAIAVWIIADSRGRLFFLQERVGRNCQTFTLYKFRTMTDEPRPISKQPVIGKAVGVTRAGYFLRKFKLDELPQLIHVLKGDMSLVGPRPSVPEQLNDMTNKEKIRYSMRPGLTGLAQVSGNIHMPWKERFIYDFEYVENVSFLNDLRILFRTAVVVFVGEEFFVGKPLRIGKRLP